MARGPAVDSALTDADVPRWWQALGLPGLVDIHTHFMPEPVMRAVWAYFERAEENYGTAWPVHYQLTEAERVSRLRSLGVRRFTSLVYAHKPDMAQWLNRWARDFAAGTPDCVPSATFFPEPDVVRYVGAALEVGARVFKVHLQVGGYDPRDPLLDPVWGMLAEAGVPVVVHCGSGPLAGAFTGPGPFGDVLARHPRLTAVIAHAGAPEYREHLTFVRRYPNVHLDTTMVGTSFLDALAPLPPDVVRRYADHGDRIVLGSDFPNIPYPYAEQLSALERFGLGEDWLRAVCYRNGARLIGLDATGSLEGHQPRG